jgi:eukaryotic-like serine/threonine-protein kinase
LGVVGFYALTGRYPFTGSTWAALLAQHLTQPAPPVASAAPEVPAAVAQAIDRCLRKAPDDRFADGAALADALGGTSLKRETPVPLRIFNKKIREVAASVPSMIVLWFLAASGVITTAFMAEPFLLLATVIALLVVAGTIFGPLSVLGSNTRRLLKAGFGIEDVRMALDKEVADRTEEIRFEHGKEVTFVDHSLRALTWSGITLGIASLGVGFLGPELEDFFVLSMFSLQTSLVTGVIGTIRNKKRRDAIGQGWLTVLRTRVGKWLFKLSSIGLDREALTSGGAHRPTEMAISIAADRLFEELPRAVRRDLSGLQETIRKLESDAQGMRHHVEEIAELLAEIGNDPNRVASDERAQLRVELEATREGAQEKMTAAVSALEKIRLGLLRLHAGAGTVESLTSDLGSAQALSEEISHLLAGKTSVEKLLASQAHSPTPIP